MIMLVATLKIWIGRGFVLDFGGFLGIVVSGNPQLALVYLADEGHGIFHNAISRWRVELKRQKEKSTTSRDQPAAEA